MKFSKIFLPLVISISLCACGQPQTASVVQPITVQNVAPTNIAKAETTTIKPVDTPVADLGTVTQPVEESAEKNNSKNKTSNNNAASSNSAVKDVIIDASGNLVVSHANGTFSSFAPAPGPAGPKGDRGSDGSDGLPGRDGIDGKDGRGIDHLELDDDKNLIAYYTDGTTQNVGNLSVTRLFCYLFNRSFIF